MRYPRNSIVINGTRDIPLLRQVRNSSFVSHDQLFTLLHHGRLEGSRRGFNWRVQRLLSSGYIHRCEGMEWRGAPVYRITRDGLLQLESHGEFVTALHSATRRPPDKARVFHALELNAVQVALARGNLLANWQSDLEIASSNMVSRGPYQKDYDAIVDVWVGDRLRRFALEYERTLKSAKQYEWVRAALAAERQVGCILYLCAGPDIALHLAHELRHAASRVAFATMNTFREQLLQTTVFTGPGEPASSFEQILIYKGLPFPGVA